jgi:vacuolar protein sorting-associated protein 35
MIDEEQEKYLDESLKVVKAQGYHIHQAIDRNNCRATLRETAHMLLELKSSLLTPSSYYQLYSVILDEMLNVLNFFKEEARRGRRMRKLYDIVQQASNIIPRLYLMIAVGSVVIENDPKQCKEIISDLLGMIKGVQSPTRGLFTRHFFMKLIKDKLPDKGNEYETENCNVEDSVNFILQNLEEMTRLWIRLSANTVGDEKILRDKERLDLKILIGENINRLSSLEGLSLELYQSKILPKLTEILLENRDSISQQYIMECIIQAFPDDYNIQCMEDILKTATQLDENVDVKTLFIILMEKLARYVAENGADAQNLVEAAEKIFEPLKGSIDKLVLQSINQPGGIQEPNKFLELELALMKFTIKCCPSNERLNTVNQILEKTKFILNAYNRKLTQDGENILKNLLVSPLESELSIFDFNYFPEIMVFLNFSSRTSLALRIIESLSHKEKLDSREKVQILLGYIRTLLEDSTDTIEVDAYQFEYEQNIVAKMLFVIKANDPFKLQEILDTLVPIFAKGGTRRIKYTLPTLVNAYLRLTLQVDETHYNKLNPNEEGTGIHKEFIKYLIMDKLSDNDAVSEFITNIHHKVDEIIKVVNTAYPDLGIKLYLSSAGNINQMKVNPEKFIDLYKYYMNNAIQMFKEIKNDQRDKVTLLANMIGNLVRFKLGSTDNIEPIADELKTLSLNLIKRADQCHAMLNCTELYFTLNNGKKAKECINKAKRFADFSMTNPENLPLFIIIINKYIYFIEATEGDNYFFEKDDVDDTIEVVKNHVSTIRNENTNQAFLPEVEKYFKDTLDIITKRAKLGKKAIYGEIIV